MARWGESTSVAISPARAQSGGPELSGPWKLASTCSTVVPSTTCCISTKCSTGVVAVFLNISVPVAGRVVLPRQPGPSLAMILPSTWGVLVCCFDPTVNIVGSETRRPASRAKYVPGCGKTMLPVSPGTSPPRASTPA